MITPVLIVILGALLVIVLMQLFKKTPTPPARTGPAEDLANLKVTDARPGDVLSISGAGDKMTDLDFTPDRGTRFEAGSHSWLELSGPYQERRVAHRVGGEEDVEDAAEGNRRARLLAGDGEHGRGLGCPSAR